MRPLPSKNTPISDPGKRELGSPRARGSRPGLDYPGRSRSAVTPSKAKKPARGSDRSARPIGGGGVGVGRVEEGAGPIQPHSGSRPLSLATELQPRLGAPWGGWRAEAAFPPNSVFIRNETAEGISGSPH